MTAPRTVHAWIESDDGEEYELRAKVYAGCRQTWTDPGEPPYLDAIEVDDGSAWVHAEDVKGIDLDAAREALWDATADWDD